jgi:hypothetical protein
MAAEREQQTQRHVAEMGHARIWRRDTWRLKPRGALPFSSSERVRSGGFVVSEV